MSLELLRANQINQESKPRYLDGIWDFDPIGIDLRMAVTTQVKLAEMRAKMSEVDGKFPVHERAFAGKVYLISASEDFEIFEKPHKSWSKKQGSEAYYILRSKDGKILVQAMLPYRRSSKHNHDGPEEYYQIHGRLLLLENQQIQELSSKKYNTSLPPEVDHQVLTLQEPSFSLIICNFTEHRYK